MKTRNLCNGMAIVAIVALAFACIACDTGDGKVPQSKDITVGTNKTVTVNFTALPGTTPAWWDTLESALKSLGTGFPVGNYTLNVTSGTSSFVKASSKTATVSDAWLSKSSYDEIRTGINGINDAWVE